MNGNNRLKIPGQVDIGCRLVAGPNAHPVTMIINAPDGAQAIAFGGLTKLEWMAGTIAAGASFLSVQDTLARAKEILEACNAAQETDQTH